MSELLKATHQGVLKINGIEISCAVLEGGRRVISERSITDALGAKASGQFWRKRKEGAIAPRYLYANFLTPYISLELNEKLSDTIKYVSVSKVKSVGLPAEILPEICDVWITANDKGAVPEGQTQVAANAYTLLKGFATVGIIALIDEATGYQDERMKGALAEILERYLLDQHKPYIGAFPTDFYRQIYRLNGWPWNPNSTKRPGVIGTWTNDIVYERMAPGVLAELQKRNPTIKPGARKHKHFQFLTDNVGDPALKGHFDGILALQRAASNWRVFQSLLNRAYPKFPPMPELDFPDAE